MAAAMARRRRPQAAGSKARAAEANVYNSPGWKRLQARAGQRGMAQPGESRNTVIDLDAVSSFTVGERVFHQKFGYGAVTGDRGRQAGNRFRKGGQQEGRGPVRLGQRRHSVLTAGLRSSRSRWRVISERGCRPTAPHPCTTDHRRHCVLSGRSEIPAPCRSRRDLRSPQGS